MNSDEIERFLGRRLVDFDGVFSIDTLPDRPRLLVCNTDPSDKPGRHWVANWLSTSTTTAIAANFLTLSDVDLMMFLNDI